MTNRGVDSSVSVSQAKPLGYANVPASYEELVSTYDHYLTVHLEFTELVGAGVSGDPWADALVAERDTTWDFYVRNGGWEPPLHSGATPTDQGRTPGGRRQLKRGSKGEDVRELQELLGIKADADFGRKTDLAVREFQEDVDLNVDGIVGPKTWRALLNPFTPAGHESTDPATDPGDEFDVCPEGDNVITLPPEMLRWGQAEAWCGDPVTIDGASIPIRSWGKTCRR